MSSIWYFAMRLSTEPSSVTRPLRNLDLDIARVEAAVLHQALADHFAQAVIRAL